MKHRFEGLFLGGELYPFRKAHCECYVVVTGKYSHRPVLAETIALEGEYGAVSSGFESLQGDINRKR